MLIVGIVGPRDLVTSTTRIVNAVRGVSAVPLHYLNEKHTPRVLQSAPSTVDAWLFTGIVPYQIANARKLLDRPAVHLDYTGATLLVGMVRLLREGHDISSMSIDVIDAAQVAETLKEVGLSMRRVRVLPYRPGLGADEMVRFHRDCAERGTAIAITCLRSAYDQLRPDLSAIRLAPSLYSVRASLNQLLLACGEERGDDAQMALGICEITAAAEADLRREISGLGGTVVRYDAKSFLIVTTRGPLESATSGFADLPMLASLRADHGSVRVGFGVGGSGAEAEMLARRALKRAKRAGRTAAMVSMRNDIDLQLNESAQPRAVQRAQLQIISQRAGLSKATLVRLQEMVRHGPESSVTTRSVAEYLGVQQRTARRVLNRLERAGVARDTGRQTLAGGGRPLVVYRLYL